MSEGTTGPEPTNTPATQSNDDHGSSGDGEQDAPQQQQPKDESGRLKSEAAQYRRQLREAQAELETLKLSQASEHERAIALAKKEGSEEATNIWRSRFHDAARRNEALRIMSGRVVDPELAMPHLHLDEVEVDEDGKVDSRAIEQVVQGLLDTYPLLAAQANGAPPVHHADLGAKPRPANTSDPNKLLREAMMGQKRRH